MVETLSFLVYLTEYTYVVFLPFYSYICNKKWNYMSPNTIQWTAILVDRYEVIKVLK